MIVLFNIFFRIPCSTERKSIYLKSFSLRTESPRRHSALHPLSNFLSLVVNLRPGKSRLCVPLGNRNVMDARTLLLLVSLLFPLAGTPDSVEPDVVEPASGAGDEEEEDEEDE